MRIKKFFIATAVGAATCFTSHASDTDSVPSGYSRVPLWHIGAGLSPSAVIRSNAFLKGENSLGKAVNSGVAADLRAAFSFNKSTREGLLYDGVYQGIGIGFTSFSPSGLLGTPVSVYVYQGAPIAHINGRTWMGYEWQFGADFGWKHYSTDALTEKNLSVSTAVTAHMGVRLTFNYEITPRFRAIAGVQLNHSSNGNTSWPNGGVNTVGGTLAVAYTLNPQTGSSGNNDPVPSDLYNQYRLRRWFYDITLYGATRKRVVTVGNPPERQLCPGHFAVAGIQISPMWRINRWVATGGSVDFKWDESAGLEPYWIEGSYQETLKFRRPPFRKQIGLGAAAHAQLTMPIFSIDAALGYSIINPKGDKRFYQSLTLKTFVLPNLYLNVGYRLGKFRDPQNLMLGAGIRI